MLRIRQKTRCVVSSRSRRQLCTSSNIIDATSDTFAKKNIHWWRDIDNRLQYFRWLEKRLNIKELSDWYSIGRTQLLENGAYKLLVLYRHSFPRAIMDTYTDHKWQAWKFVNARNTNWRDPALARDFIDTLMTTLNWTMDNLYSLTADHFIQHGGRSFLAAYNHSPSSILLSAYPDHPWQIWRFEKIPHHWWQVVENQRRFILSIMERYNMTSLDEFYNFSKEEFIASGGRTLLKLYKESMVNMLTSVFPEHNWEIWKFKSVPQRWWRELTNRQEWLTSLMSRLGLTSLEDLYSVTYQQIVDNGGIGLMMMYNHSTTEAIMASFPDHQWIPWKFNAVPKGYWDSPLHVREYCDWLYKTLGMKSMNDWYRIRTVEFRKNYGAGLMRVHNSVYAILQKAYPEHPWNAWKFSIRGASVSITMQNATTIMDALGETLCITTKEDWYSVAASDIPQEFREKVRILGGLHAALTRAYPSHKWDPRRFLATSPNAKTQLLICTYLREFYPDWGTAILVRAANSTQKNFAPGDEVFVQDADPSEKRGLVQLFGPYRVQKVVGTSLYLLGDSGEHIVDVSCAIKASTKPTKAQDLDVNH